jgi:hypothetical protein
LAICICRYGLVLDWVPEEPAVEPYCALRNAYNPSDHADFGEVPEAGDVGSLADPRHPCHAVLDPESDSLVDMPVWLPQDAATDQAGITAESVRQCAEREDEREETAIEHQLKYLVQSTCAKCFYTNLYPWHAQK